MFINTHNLTEHVGWLFGMALNKTNRIDEAEDLVQETFLAALGALEKGTAIENPKSFLPVLKIDELELLCHLTKKCNKTIAEKFHDEIMSLMKNPVKTPPHLKSVPNFLRYLPCAEGFSMQLILKAHEEGLFLPGIDLEKNPVPAVVLAVCE